jgi:limonene-1,2-epoxide hydrolase
MVGILSLMDAKRYDQLVRLAEDYMRSLNALDVESYIAVFTPDCVVHDPYGGAQFAGENGLREFFEGMLKTWHFFEMRADSVYPGGYNRLAVRWSVSATAKNRKTAEFSGISVFTFSSDKIVVLEAYWNLRTMLKQIGD